MTKRPQMRTAVGRQRRAAGLETHGAGVVTTGVSGAITAAAGVLALSGNPIAGGVVGTVGTAGLLVGQQLRAEGRSLKTKARMFEGQTAAARGGSAALGMHGVVPPSEKTKKSLGEAARNTMKAASAGSRAGKVAAEAAKKTRTEAYTDKNGRFFANGRAINQKG